MDSDFQISVDEIAKGMSDFMPHGDYEQANIDECVSILRNFQVQAESATTREAALVEVKNVVLELNKLNEKCDDSLIETDQREGICLAIIGLTKKIGFNDEEEDVTEEWREW